MYLLAPEIFNCITLLRYPTSSWGMVNPSKLKQYANGYNIGPIVLNCIAFPTQKPTKNNYNKNQ